MIMASFVVALFFLGIASGVAYFKDTPVTVGILVIAVGNFLLNLALAVIHAQ